MYIKLYQAVLHGIQTIIGTVHCTMAGRVLHGFGPLRGIVDSNRSHSENETNDPVGEHIRNDHRTRCQVPDSEYLDVLHTGSSQLQPRSLIKTDQNSPAVWCMTWDDNQYDRECPGLA